MDSSHFCMSWDLFEKFILQLKSFSDDLKDDWSFHKINGPPNGSYLSKKVYKTYNEDVTSDELEEFEDDNLVDEQSVLKSENRITYEYHVAYNVSYSCPVLCFNAWKSNGSLLTMEECWQMIDLSSSTNKFEVLTQLTHPVLAKPFLTLHPCKTAELIGASFEKSKNPIVSWLSAVGPVVGLNVKPDYAKLTF